MPKLVKTAGLKAWSIVSSHVVVSDENLGILHLSEVVVCGGSGEG